MKKENTEKIYKCPKDAKKKAQINLKLCVIIRIMTFN